MMYIIFKNMSQKLIVWSIVFVLSVGSSLAATFLSVAPDIPLAPGLSEAETGALIFDKPEGRIVSIEALAGTPSADIFAFYRLSLPNLGWQIKPELAVRNSETFHREDEALTIKYEGGVVFFRLQPIAGN
ncbi:MAG: hypothetical protein QF505_01400 [Candidatus Micropelagos thuwalensis]|nr:hypothetical protein [Candidatus Micropelagos thuwalensis]